MSKLLKCLVLTSITFHLALSQQIDVEGGIQVGAVDDESPEPGTIRWTGFEFEGWNGEAWVSLSGGKTGPILDIDGNSYSTITIGDQIWMADNLRTTKYRSGSPIAHVVSNLVWDTLSTGAWCWYEN